MNNFKKVTLAALTAITTIVPTAVEAKNVDRGHMDLVRAIASTGVELKINPEACYENPDKTLYGWYWAAKNEMVICQENATHYNTETYWTAEDFDTLRHEAQHLIQDCRDGSLNGSLDSVYKEPIKLALDVLGESKSKSIIRTYSDSSEHIQVMELEAFAVAAMNDPADQSNDIKTYCF